eukprot:CAMPEP_0170139018 /NCGR_PEP_ID=MMETSP0033_2-20121228/5343_1 /TAXON_ID=195969 /ORGANISM="Dolichomastix tenuilepis, Strain CCMP3274" /LENGTH=497 /DNA_ID=CAMNT_0010375093 /DNA_START=37 /DNA_END=1534 /DNA_ORIENTATION=-
MQATSSRVVSRVSTSSSGRAAPRVGFGASLSKATRSFTGSVAAFEARSHTSGRAVRVQAMCKAGDQVSASYAQALVETAQAAGVLESVHSDMETLAGYLAINSDFVTFLSNPVLPDAKKKEVIDTLAKEAGFHAYTSNILCLAVDKGRIQLLSTIIEEFDDLYCAATETQVAKVTSAIALENEQQFLIAKKLQEMTGAKNIKLKPEVDESLLGGFVVQYGKDGSGYIDMSIKGQLEKLATEMGATVQFKSSAWLAGDGRTQAGGALNIRHPRLIVPSRELWCEHDCCLISQPLTCVSASGHALSRLRARQPRPWSDAGTSARVPPRPQPTPKPRTSPRADAPQPRQRRASAAARLRLQSKYRRVEARDAVPLRARTHVLSTVAKAVLRRGHDERSRLSVLSSFDGLKARAEKNVVERELVPGGRDVHDGERFAGRLCALKESLGVRSRGQKHLRDERWIHLEAPFFRCEQEPRAQASEHRIRVRERGAEARVSAIER